MGLQIEVFCVYAHKDLEYLKELRVHLRPLERQGLIKIWNDIDITPGADWEREIYRHLSTAQLILLLVSPDFMASDYCYNIEMDRAMKRQSRGEARVIPIIIRPAHWQIKPLKDLQALPKEARPITLWENRDAAFLDVVQSIQKAIDELNIWNDILPPKSPGRSSTANPRQNARGERGPIPYKRRIPSLTPPNTNMDDYSITDYAVKGSQKERSRRKFPESSNIDEDHIIWEQDEAGNSFGSSPTGDRARRKAGAFSPKLDEASPQKRAAWFRLFFVTLGMTILFLAVLLSAAVLPRSSNPLLIGNQGGHIYNIQVGGKDTTPLWTTATPTPTCTPQPASQQNTTPTPIATCTPHTTPTPPLTSTATSLP